MALDSGRKITRFAWTNLPMPDIVIKRIEEMAKGQPEDLIFTDRKGRLIADNEIPGVDGDEIEDPQDNDPIVESDDLDDENELAAQAIAEAAAAAELAPEPEPELTILEPAPTAAPEITNNPLEAATPMMAPEPPPAPEEPSNNQPSEATAEPAVEPGETAGVGRPKRNRAPPKSYIPSMKGNRYSYACQALPGGALHPDLHMVFLQHMIEEVPDTVGAILTQFSMKAGLKEWGKDAEKAVYDEMKQLHFRNTFVPKH